MRQSEVECVRESDLDRVSEIGSAWHTVMLDKTGSGQKVPVKVRECVRERKRERARERQ